MAAGSLPLAVVAKLQTFFAGLLTQLVGGIIAFLVVVLFLAIGYIVAWVVAAIVRRAMDEMEVENRIAEYGISPSFGRFTLTSIINFFLMTYIIFAFLGAATDIVALGFFAQVIGWILEYIPSLIQGIVILVSALLFARYIGDLIREKEELAMGDAVSFVLKLFIGYTALVLSLPLLLPGIQTVILEQAFTLFVGAISVAVGFGFAISLGWGMKDAVSISAKRHQKLFDEVFENVTEKRKKRSAKQRRAKR